MKLVCILAVLFYAVCSFAGIPEDFEKIKDNGRDLEPTGAICEEIAQLRFSEMYPAPEYEVVTGIQYSDEDGTVGELDLIVFNKEKVAEVIGEVKCWTNAKSGLKKAEDQRKRFQKNVNSPKALQFKWLNDPSRKLTKTQFNKAKKFVFIAQSGTFADGYDYELPYTLAELMHLRADLLNCQAQGNCKKHKTTKSSLKDLF